MREVLEARRGQVAAHVALAQAELDRGGSTAKMQARLRDDALDPGGSTRVGLRWQLPAIGAEGARRASVKAEMALSRAESTLVDAELAAQVRLDHLAARTARRAAATAEQSAKLARTSLEAMDRRLTAGTVTPVARAAAALSLATAEATQKAAAAARDAAEARAKTWTGRAADDASCDPSVSPDVAEKHPEVVAAREDIARVHARAHARSAEAWPWPYIQVAWDRDANGPDRALVYFGAPIPLPGDSPGDVEDAQLRVRTADAQAIRVRVRRELARARAALDGAVAALAALDSEATRVQAAETVASRAEAAKATASEAVRLRRALLDWQERRTDAREAVERARIEVRRQQGRP